MICTSSPKSSFRLSCHFSLSPRGDDLDEFYCINNAKYCDLINDFRIICKSFKELCQSILTPGSYADMIYAPAVLSLSQIQSFMPSVGAADERCTVHTQEKL